MPLRAIDLASPRLRPRALGRILTEDVDDRYPPLNGTAYRDVVRAFRGRIDQPPTWSRFRATRRRSRRVLEGALASAASRRSRTAAAPRSSAASSRASPTATAARLGRPRRARPGRSRSTRRRAPRASRPARSARARGRAAAARADAAPLPAVVRVLDARRLARDPRGRPLRDAAHAHRRPRRAIRARHAAGARESHRLPGSGAGRSPDRMLLGSEGTLGVITEAWMRVLPRPRWRRRRRRFSTLRRRRRGGTRARAVGPAPANAACSTRRGAAHRRRCDGDSALLAPRLRVGRSPARRPIAARSSARAITAAAWSPARRAPVGALRDATPVTGVRSGRQLAPGVPRRAVPARRAALDRRPQRHVRDRVHVDRFAELPRRGARGGPASDRRCSAPPRPARRVSAAASPTSIPTARRRTTRSSRRRAAAARSRSGTRSRPPSPRRSIDAGGTITHHHAVGRDHRPWYDRQRPDPFAEALRGAKRALDPAGVLNPGVLIDP